MSEPNEPSGNDNGEMADDDDLVFDFDAAIPSITDKRGILTALHQRCSRSPQGGQASALLVSVDGQGPFAREHGEQMAAKVREEAYARLTANLPAAVDAGLLDEELLLILIEGVGPEAAAAEMDSVRTRAGQIQIGSRTFPVTYSAAATGVTHDDLPEAIVGRLNRALLRVMMGGGERTDITD